MASRNVEPYIPTVDKARAAGLDVPTVEPRDEQRLVALAVVAELHDPQRGAKFMFDTYVPSHLKTTPALFEFEVQLEANTTLIRKEAMPEELRCRDLRPIKAGGAYRQAQESKPPRFHDFEFGGTIERATEELERFFLGSKPTRSNIRAYAWPLLWLRYDALSTAGEGPDELVIYMSAAKNPLLFAGHAPAPE